MQKTILALAITALAGCVDETNTRRALAEAGYSEVETTGWEAFACGQDDTFSTGFRATNPAGRRVTGVVCCGLVLKACTIRH